MIRIVTESMSDFTQEEAKAADLIVMPLPIRFGMAADSLRHGGILG